MDFLTKPFQPERLLVTVRVGLQASLSSWKDHLLELEAVRACFAALTIRQKEVLPFVLGSYLNKQTAAELGMSEKTVKFHRMHILDKLGVDSVAELSRLAARVGIEPAPRPR